MFIILATNRILTQRPSLILFQHSTNEHYHHQQHNNNDTKRCNSIFSSQSSHSSLCWKLSPTRMLMWPRHNRAQIMFNTSGANFVQHVVSNVVGCFVLFVGCLTSQQHASVSQGRICTDNFTCCHTEIEAADQTFHLTQSQYTDTGPTSPSADPITPGAWQGSHWSANF